MIGLVWGLFLLIAFGLGAFGGYSLFTFSERAFKAGDSSLSALGIITLGTISLSCAAGIIGRLLQADAHHQDLMRNLSGIEEADLPNAAKAMLE